MRELSGMKLQGATRKAEGRPRHGPETLLVQKSVASFEGVCEQGFYKVS